MNSAARLILGCAVLVATMLRADRTVGAQSSILIASHVGALLYRAVGYQTIGTVLVLNPPRV